MADNCSNCLQDFMDRLWFHQNILLWEPSGISLQSLMRSKRTNSGPPSSSSSSNIETVQSTDENENTQPIRREKMPTRLNIVIDQPLFQLQQPARNNLRSHPSSPCIYTGSPSKHRTRMPKKMRSHKSMSELENYELKGFTDLGFTFNKDKLSPQMKRIIPGLQRIREDSGGSEISIDVNEKHFRRPYLSEAWLISQPDFSLLNPQMLSKSQGADMKNHLRFWARNVASLIHRDLELEPS
ncbi:uncharacterized protein [Typha latifolia]|uniref:uncharacterized protein n=1 Tax=Typha latifolia TaxID=4733 RepID=UPI003C2C3AEE